MRTLRVVIALFVVVAACSSGELSLSDYAERADALIEEVDGRLDVAVTEIADQPDRVNATLEYFALRVESYEELVDGFAALTPPERITDLHARIMDVFSRQLDAERERIAVGTGVTTVDDLDELWNGPTAQKIWAIEQEAIEICITAQQVMDATATGKSFQDVPWMPREAAEVVTIAFDCPPQ